MIYISMIAVVLISGIVFIEHTPKSKTLFCFIASFALIFVMASRNITVGVDTARYAVIYRQIVNRNFTDIFCISDYRTYLGYALLMKCCSIISPNYYFFQIVFSILYCIGTIKFIKKNSSDILFGLIIFISSGLYLAAFNIARQMLAMIVAIQSWPLIKKHKNKSAMAYVLLATTIHFTALFSGIYLVLYLLKEKYPQMIKFIPIMTFATFFLYEVLIDLARIYLPLYHNYYANAKVIHTAGGVKIIWALIIILSIYLIYFNTNKVTSEFQLPAAYSLIYIMTNIIGLSFNYFERLGIYFQPFVIIMLESVMLVLENYYIKIIYKLFVQLCYIAYFFLSCTSNQYQYTFFY